MLRIPFPSPFFRPPFRPIIQLINTLTTEKNEKSNSETWIRVIMKESTEVNGVRFPEGIQIDVTEEDSKKLIESGKAAIIA